MQLPNNVASLTDELAKLPQQKIAKAISAVLLVYIAYLAAQATWMFVPSAQNSSVKVKSFTQVLGQTKTPLNIDEIDKLNLFGLYNAKPVVKKVEIEDAPVTRLKLTLSAAVASDDNDAAAAIIESQGKQETYGIGDMIKGTRATLEQVLIDRVHIKQSGRMETLMLEGFDYKKLSESESNQRLLSGNNKKSSAQGPRKSDVIDKREDRVFAQQASNLKADILQDPAKITDYLKISPKRVDGEIVGYRLMPGKEPEFFKGAGLKSGDVAIQMNGYDLTLPSEAAQAMMALRSETDISLMVLREDGISEILFSVGE